MKIWLLIAAIGAAFLLVTPHQDNSAEIVATLNQIPGVHAHVGGK